ncbi:MAG: hypothetical protein WD423_02570 [Rhodothermales bacterium]
MYRLIHGLARVAVALTLLLACAPAAAQVISIRSAGLSSSWYAPDLGLYDDQYLLDFGGSVLAEAHLEFDVLGIATLRTSTGHWQSTGRGDAREPDGRPQTATLRIVPFTAALLVQPDARGGPVPVFGAGITQNLVQRSFRLARIDEPETFDTFSGNGRDYTYHGLVGINLPVGGAVRAGFEWRYVWGRFREEPIPAARSGVALDGLQFGLSLQYRIR